MKTLLKRSRLFWTIAPVIGRFVPLRFFARVPDHIVIDVTNTCNIRCPVCPIPTALTRPRGLMSIETFTVLIDELVRAGKRPLLNFAWSGEPTLNKALPDFIAYATKHGFSTTLSTNVMRLDAVMATRLVDAGLTTATLCLDGFDAETHERYRIGSKFEKVKANIAQFIRINRERNGKTLCQLQTLVTSYSEPQLDDIIAWAKEIGIDIVSLKTFNVSLDAKMTKEQRKNFLHFLPSLPFRRNRSNAKATLCRTPLSQSVVYWDGSIGLCCVDMDRDVKLPSILESGFVSVVLSNEVATARKKGFLKRHEICDGCTLSGADEVTRKIYLAPAP